MRLSMNPQGSDELAMRLEQAFPKSPTFVYLGQDGTSSPLLHGANFEVWCRHDGCRARNPGWSGFSFFSLVIHGLIFRV